MYDDHNYGHNNIAQLSNLEVLNISNVNARNGIVLNDEKLLELVQIYPFLYDPHVKPFRDPDYDEWAWSNIGIAFNKSYEGYPLNAPFTAQELRRRWEFLQPIVMGLSKVSESIPPSMRHHVLKISHHLENNLTDVVQKPLSGAQSIIFENIEMVKKLPLQQRKQLEADIMRIILTREQSDELEPRLIHKNNCQCKQVCQGVEKECEDFFKKIGIDEMNIVYDDGVFADVDTATSPSTPSHNKEICNGTTAVTSKTVPPLRIKSLSSMPHIDNPKGSPSPSTSSYQQLSNNPLLMPLDRPRWIDIDKASFYIRKCSVRLKRYKPPEDEVPLARLKKEKWD